MFAATYYINLDRRADRREHVEKELRVTGLTATRFLAIEPADRAGWGNTGVRGCLESHLGVVRTARRLGLPSVLVLEDDVAFRDGVTADTFECYHQALERRPWDVWYGFVGKRARRSQAVTAREPLLPGHDLVRIVRTLGMHCYAVHARAYDRWISAVERNTHKPIDTFLARRVLGDMSVYAADADLAFQRLALGSDLSARRAGRARRCKER